MNTVGRPGIGDGAADSLPEKIGARRYSSGHQPAIIPAAVALKQKRARRVSSSFLENN
jgi:hypothetical protein